MSDDIKNWQRANSTVGEYKVQNVHLVKNQNTLSGSIWLGIREYRGIWNMNGNIISVHECGFFNDLINITGLEDKLKLIPMSDEEAKQNKINKYKKQIEMHKQRIECLEYKIAELENN